MSCHSQKSASSDVKGLDLNMIDYQVFDGQFTYSMVTWPGKSQI